MTGKTPPDRDDQTHTKLKEWTKPELQVLDVVKEAESGGGGALDGAGFS